MRWILLNRKNRLVFRPLHVALNRIQPLIPLVALYSLNPNSSKFDYSLIDKTKDVEFIFLTNICFKYNLNSSSLLHIFWGVSIFIWFVLHVVIYYKLSHICFKPFSKLCIYTLFPYCRIYARLWICPQIILIHIIRIGEQGCKKKELLNKFARNCTYI